MGGMTVLAFAAQFPGVARNLLSISGAAGANPFAIALRSLQREIVRNDPAWRGGNYEPGRGPRQGMRIARKLGTITYRSHEEWEQRFGRRRVAEPSGQPGDFRAQFEVESYLEHQGQRFADVFDANCYLYLSRAMDQFDLAEHGGGSLDAAFAKLRGCSARWCSARRPTCSTRSTSSSRSPSSCARPASTWSSTRSRRCRATTRSWSMPRGSSRPSGTFSKVG